MKKLTHLSILTCAFSCLTAYSMAAQRDDQSSKTNDVIPDFDKGSVTLELDDKNVLVVQNARIIVQNTKNGKNRDTSSKPNGMQSDIQPSTSPTPPAMIILGYEAEPFISVDYLFWTARQDNMEFVFNYKTDEEGNAIGKSRVKAPDWEYDSGFRVGAGLDFRHDGWDTYLNYTWYHPERASKKVSVSGVPSDDDPQNQLIPAWTVVTSENIDTPISDASGSWKFQYDDLTWELGRNFFISQYLTLRPFAGLETSWQHQKQRLFFNSVDPDAPRQFNLSNHVHFWGIGIRIGLDTAWYVYKKNLSIIADLALSGLWSRTRTVQKLSVFNVEDAATTTSLNLHNSFHAIRPVIDWMLGMQWESWFYDNRMKFSFRAAWEEQVWINQNALPELFFFLSYKARGGDLSIEGLTLRARFDF